MCRERRKEIHNLPFVKFCNCSGVEYWKQVNNSTVRATAAYNKEGELIFLKTLEDIAQFVRIPANVISKAMPQNIEKYHK